MKKFGRAIVSRYNSYRLKERSKVYLHNTSPFNTKIALSESIINFTYQPFFC